MRNLKKFLALVMAMVMTFSLMLSVNAANTAKTFGDADQITEAFVEAADVLTGMKVFQGDEGGFRPGDNINRAEVAALIYRLATGDTGTEKMDLYTTTHPFTDVNADDWFAGYVGYCWNAGYIKGTTATTFNPYDSVTGYETLAMVLRAMGYDKNNEFTGSQWIVNVSATATQRGLLDDVKTTHYGNTLHLASRRDVVASILFKAAQKARVVYTPAFGYQSGDHTSNAVTDLYNDYSSLGWVNFGLVSTDKGVVIGNQQTGEKNTRLGFPGVVTGAVVSSGVASFVVNDVDSVLGYDDDASANIAVAFSITPYAWEGTYSAKGLGLKTTAGTALADDDTFTLEGNNNQFEVETGIDLVGHKVKIWFDGRPSKYDTTKGRPTYAYFDKAKTDVVYADNTNLTDNDTADKVDLAEAIGDTELKVAGNDKAVFNNSFGKFGTLSLKADNDATDADEVSLGSGDGLAKNGYNTGTYDEAYFSPVGLYKIISNNKDNTVDAVIALNIESSQITESNSVNRVPTIGVPVYNWTGAAEETYDAAGSGSYFVEGVKSTAASTPWKSDNLKAVPVADTGVITGVIAKDALVGNSASALGDYEMGIHITGTTRRDVSDNEATAINSATTKDELESSYFLLNKVTATVEGTVVSYNRTAGTVTLDNGTVLERSKFYDTVVVKNPKDGTAAPAVTATQAPISAIPQGWVYDKGAAMDDALDQWVEGYANTTYKFYTDHEGKYLGAERTYGASFLYGTYLDYDQKLSTSTFNYYLTGVTLNGEIETVPVSEQWAALDDSKAIIPSFWTDGTVKGLSSVKKLDITGTNHLFVPYRDTANSATTSVNGLGMGIYRGFTIQGTTADGIVFDTNADRNEYLMNMARLGIKFAGYSSVYTMPVDADTAGNAPTVNKAFDIREIDIDKDDITLGARETINGRDLDAAKTDTDLTSQSDTSNKYFTEATKFILVSGFGTDSVKAEVFNGISELKGDAAHVFIKMNGADPDGAGSLTHSEIKLNDAWGSVAANMMTYYTESPYTYAQSGDTAMKIDTIILPKKAVSWSGGSGLYYVGNPGYSMINSWGTDAWKYDLYEDGELKQVWLTNDPSNAATPGAAGDKTYNLVKDTFYNLKDTGKKANDGQPIYTAGNYSASGVWVPGTGITVNANPTQAALSDANQYTMTAGATQDGVIYSAVTRDAQTATFTQSTDSTKTQLYRVAGAKVVNLNKDAKAGGSNTVQIGNKSQSGEIWPGITDLTTLNEAGSINPVTGRSLKVAAVVDPDNPLVITTIYVCWDQDTTDA